MSETSDPLIPDPSQPQTKRKRNQDDIAELEIDINLPEPASKKARRKEEKKAATKTTTKQPSDLSLAAGDLVKAYFDGDTAQHSQGPQAAQKRSEYGIWIGNLPFTATREILREFLKREGGIEGRDVIRLHLPAPHEKGEGERKAQNKGFAYIDFTTEEVVGKALALSEKLVSGRRVLIKPAKSFEGRPEQKPAEETRSAGKKAPSKRVFVGNLGFDVTREDVWEHFSRAGEVEDVFLASFEDSGKCKGFGWVRFGEVEAAGKAVRGFVFEDDGEEEGASGEDAGERDDVGAEGVKAVEMETKHKQNSKRQKQQKKWFINRLHGRPLRCEFAEDPQTRYKKRFNSKHDAAKSSRHDEEDPNHPAAATVSVGNGDAEIQDLAQKAAAARPQKPRKAEDKEQRREDRRKRHDARTVAPGKALASTQRASGAIVEGSGRKIQF